MAKFKTNTIKPLKKQGGTFCTFASAMEDIGLNINEKNNKVRLSHYAILDIPNCDYSNKNSNKNVFNLLTAPDAFYKNIDNTSLVSDTNDEINNYVRRNIAQSFMSYALNMEAVVRNNNTASSTYDFTRHLTVSERVFWKWLKETGAIRWQRYNNEENCFVEEQNNSDYSRVVQAFGKIDAVAMRSSDYGMYNEIFVNIPSSFGGIDNIYFKQINDDNYSFDKNYQTYCTDRLENHNTTITNEENLLNIPYFDGNSTLNKKDEYTTNNKKGFWYNEITKTSNEKIGYYITDKKLENDTSINDIISIKNKNVNYTITRSKLDCMTLELDLNNINKINNTNNTFDELNINTQISNYTFNTILVYYSIYDDNDKILATNLYGVYFIDSPQQLNINSSNPSFINFEIPRLTKKQSTVDGFGTSYSFKFNIRSSSLFDGEDDIIYDNSSSENSIVTDFNDVVSYLLETIKLLNKSTKNTFILQEKYKKLENICISQESKINELKNRVKLLEDKKV